MSNTLGGLEVRVEDLDRASAFFGAVFGWRLVPCDLGYDVAHALTTAYRQPGPVPSPRLGFYRESPQANPAGSGTGRPYSAAARLAVHTPDLSAAMRLVEEFGGVVESGGDAVTGSLCRDPQAIALRLVDGAQASSVAIDASGRARGDLGVIFLFVEDLPAAAAFYEALLGWQFIPVGRDGDILFVRDGPLVGLRSTANGPRDGGGRVAFHVSVPLPELDSVLEALWQHGGTAGPPVAAGADVTRSCTDDQSTQFSLWYPVAE